MVSYLMTVPVIEKDVNSPHGVDCGKRQFVQGPQAGIDVCCPLNLNHSYRLWFVGQKCLIVTKKTAGYFDTYGL